jgi:hypothetical protein
MLSTIYDNNREIISWRVNASAVDAEIDRLILERLRLTTIDEVTWQRAIASNHDRAHIDIRRVQNAIRSAENA